MRKKPQQVVSYGLKYADYDRIMETIPGIREAVAIREIRKQIRARSHAIDGRVVGTTASYDKVNPLEVERGRFLTDDDHAKYQNRAVIGSEIARALFPEENPIGEAVKLGTDYYTIVGVLKERANTSVISGRFESHDVNKDVYIPLNTCKLRFGERIIINQGQSPRAEETQLARLTLRLRDEANVEETPVDPIHPQAVPSEGRRRGDHRQDSGQIPVVRYRRGFRLGRRKDGGVSDSHRPFPQSRSKAGRPRHGATNVAARYS